jgi:hypothetical protein
MNTTFVLYFARWNLNMNPYWLLWLHFEAALWRLWTCGARKRVFERLHGRPVDWNEALAS